MDYFKTLRPDHWIKNLIIFAPIFFAKEIFIMEKLESVFFTFLSFCLTASCIYILNDISDKDLDSRHSKKSARPIAAGKVGVKSALSIAVLLLLGASLLIYFYVPQTVYIIAAYFILSLLYSLFFKHIVILDILVISFLYLLRVLAGGIASATVISNWLILCTIFVSLFLITGKRKAEFKEDNRRKVLDLYNENLLEHLLTVSVVLSIMSYSLYTILGTTKEYTIYSVFIILFGIFRYLFLIYFGNKAENPEKLLFTDKYILLSMLSWSIYMFINFYA